MNIVESVKIKGKVTIRGWIKELRDLKKIKFIILRDGTGEIQIILKGADESLNNIFESLTKESYIEVTGDLVDSKQAKLGKEMIPDSINIIAKSEAPFPIDISGKIESGLDARIDWRFLDMRREDVLKVFKLQSELIRLMSEYMWKHGFTRIFSSKMVDAPTEGGTEYFEIKYFDRKAYLAQSPQFYKEMALLSGLDKVFEIGSVYRAEPHHTTRHLCEYTSFDLEFVCNSMKEVMDFQVEMLKTVFKELKLEFPKEIPIVKLSEANEILKKMKVETEEKDLTPAGERALCEWSKKEHNSDFVFVTSFPFKHKVFYAKKEGENARSFDLLYRGLEITTGGIREENFEKRKQQIIEKGMNPNDFDHLRFFRYAEPPHGGLAIGIERLTQQILGLENIREASLTPRDPNRLTP